MTNTAAPPPQHPAPCPSMKLILCTVLSLGIAGKCPCKAVSGGNGGPQPCRTPSPQSSCSAELQCVPDRAEAMRACRCLHRQLRVSAHGDAGLSPKEAARQGVRGTSLCGGTNQHKTPLPHLLVKPGSRKTQGSLTKHIKAALCSQNM